MNKIKTIFKFWFFFLKNNHLKYKWERTVNGWALKIFDINGLPVEQIFLNSKLSCKQEWLGRQWKYTALEIWESWPKPTKEDLVAGAQIYYFYDRYDILENYEIYTITDKDVERLSEYSNYINSDWARIHPDRLKTSEFFYRK